MCQARNVDHTIVTTRSINISTGMICDGGCYKLFNCIIIYFMMSCMCVCVFVWDKKKEGVGGEGGGNGVCPLSLQTES